MSIKNVIVLGAGGNLGESILSAFLNESSFNTTVLSRSGSKTVFPTGAKVKYADYESSASLKEAFQGQDAVVSLIATAAIGDQKKLIDAAIEAGVKRFLPSEYGANNPDERLTDIVPPLTAKVGIVDYLKSKEDAISWTSIITGPFFDWGLKVGFLGFDGSSKTATIWDGGKAVFSTTNLHQIGLAIIKALEKADLTKNQYVYVSGFQTSQKEILAIAEKLSGTKWTVRNIDAKEMIAEERSKLQKGDYSGIPNLILCATFEAEQQLGDYSSAGLWNGKLGLPEESLEETVRMALSL